MFLKCHSNCAECLSYSNDDSNMKCLKCISGFNYNENTFNCSPLQKYIPKNISIELINNGFFWVFLVVLVFAIVLSIFVLWQDKICKKHKSFDIEGIDQTKKILELENTNQDDNSTNSNNSSNKIN